MPTFAEKLDAACESRRSLLCVGLDPDPRRLPVADVAEFNRAIVDATADLVCAYKPNLAFYEAQGIEGLRALGETVGHIRDVARDALVIGDGKRGDVGPSMEAYYRAMFDVWGFDAATVSPYLGRDVLPPAGSHPGRGIFILCRTSNPSAGDFQDVPAPFGGIELPVYQHVARRCREWNIDGNLGLVIGATYPRELEAVREMCPDMPLLIPGVGTQGGDLEKAVRAGVDRRGRRAVVNSSRQVLYASSGADYPEAARREAMRLRDEINDVLRRDGVGWS